MECTKPTATSTSGNNFAQIPKDVIFRKLSPFLMPKDAYNLARSHNMGVLREPMADPLEAGEKSFMQFRGGIAKANVISQLHLQGRVIPFSIEDNALEIEHKLSKPFSLAQSIQFAEHTCRVGFACFSPDGSRILSVSDNDPVGVWSQNEGDGQWNNMALRTEGLIIQSVSFNPAGDCIVMGEVLGVVRVLSCQRDEEEVLEGHVNCVNSVSFSSDGSQIVSASDDKTIRVWSRSEEDHKWRSVVLSGHTDCVSSANFSPDGHRIVTASDDNSVRVWSRGAEDGSWKSEALDGHKRGVNSVSFSPDNSQIVSASDDNTVRVWSYAADFGKWHSVVLAGHESRVNSVSFSPDGRQIVSASDDQSIRIWERGEDDSWSSVALVGHTESVNSVSFNPDGCQIVTASSDHNLRLWSRG